MPPSSLRLCLPQAETFYPSRLVGPGRERRAQRGRLVNAYPGTYHLGKGHRVDGRRETSRYPHHGRTSVSFMKRSPGEGEFGKSAEGHVCRANFLSEYVSFGKTIVSEGKRSNSM